ncbi:hypothetical protein RFI_37154, partial [Reticulomyxa filosa]
CVRNIISSYSSNRNISDGEYPMFVRDLLAVIKRVESICKDTKQQHTYTTLLRSLYNENKESVILQMQLLRDMCIHQCVNNDTLSLQSKDAVLLNRCLEKILLEENANANNALITNWAQWCCEQGHDKFELVIRISQLKTDLSKLIWNLTNTDICMSKVEQGDSAYNLIKQMGELLSSVLIPNSLYEHMLHVWFLKQLYVCKGIHWIEILFTQPVIRQAIPPFNKTKFANIFAALDPRPLYCDFYNPLVGAYGPHSMDKIHSILMNERYRPALKNLCPILVDSLSLINLCGLTYTEPQLNS